MLYLEATFDPSVINPQLTVEEPAEEVRDNPKEIALRVVKADIEVARQASDSEKATRQDAYDLYRGSADDPLQRDGRSRVRSSDVMDMIEWLMPSLMRAFFGSKKCISVEPIGGEDIEKAEKLQKLLNWQFVDKADGFRVGHEWIKASLVYGIAPAKVTWQETYVRQGFAFPELTEPEFEVLRHDSTVETLNVGSVETKGRLVEPMANSVNFGIQPYELEEYRVYKDIRGEKKLKTFSGPLVEVIPPEDFFCDPEARDIAEARFAIHRVKRTISYLKERERDGIYSNVDTVVERTTVGSTYDDNDEASLRAMAGDRYSYNSARNDMQKARQKVDVWEWWGLLDVEEKGIAEPYLVVMANDTIIRMEKNPYAHGEPPFEIARPVLDIFSLKGISMVDLVGEYQKVKTALMRQTLDNISFQNNQMWEVDENAGVDIDSLANPRPGLIIMTDKPGGVRQIAPPPLEAGVYHTMEFIQSQLEQRTGITRYNQGLDSKSLNKTASGISAIMSASSQRIELIARVLSETGFRRLYKKMLLLNQQFIDQDIVIRVYGEPLEISPDDLAGNFDVIVDIGGATNKEEQEVTQLMTIMNYSQMLLQIGVMQPKNIYEVAKKILETWGKTDYDKYLTDPEDTMKIMAVIQQIDQLMAMAQAGQLPPIEQLAQGVMMAREALASVVGQSPEAGPNNTDKNLMARDRRGDGIAYASGIVQGGPGDGA